MTSKRPLFWVGLGAIAAVLCTAAAEAAASRPTVAILKSSNLPPFEMATEALTESLRKTAPQPEILTFDLEGDVVKAPTVLAAMYAAAPRVIVTVGSLATSAALADPSPIPVVFSMVLYPKASGFEGSEGRGVTGVALDIPLAAQFASLRRLLPAARKVGVLYHPGETGSIVTAAVAAAAQHGLTLVTREVDEPGAAVAALGGLMEEVDAVWTIADAHVFTPQTTPALILAALRRRIPLIGLSTAHVRSGALAALFCDYRDVGLQTGELVQRVLGGERADGMPVVSPHRLDLALNHRTAELLGLTIPEDVVRGAALTLP
jgi:putative tryptophan/tyrosine transport system substrate-binding protein